jgi:hypothetical protein
MRKGIFELAISKKGWLGDIVFGSCGHRMVRNLEIGSTRWGDSVGGRRGYW